MEKSSFLNFSSLESDSNLEGSIAEKLNIKKQKKKPWFVPSPYYRLFLNAK
jgi:hypothetical protein